MPDSSRTWVLLSSLHLQGSTFSTCIIKWCYLGFQLDRYLLVSSTHFLMSNHILHFIIKLYIFYKYDAWYCGTLWYCGNRYYVPACSVPSIYQHMTFLIYHPNVLHIFNPKITELVNLNTTIHNFKWPKIYVICEILVPVYRATCTYRTLYKPESYVYRNNYLVPN